MKLIFPSIYSNLFARAAVILWIVDRTIQTLENMSGDQFNAIFFQELLHVEATFYPVLTYM